MQKIYSGYECHQKVYSGRGHSFSTYTKYSEKITFISYPLMRTRKFAYQEIRNINFSENLVYVLNEWLCTTNKPVRNYFYSFIFSNITMIKLMYMYCNIIQKKELWKFWHFYRLKIFSYCVEKRRSERKRSWK